VCSSDLFSGYDICSVIDARKNEVFLAYYSFQSGTIELNGIERLCNPSQICDSMKGKTVFIGTGAKLYRDLIIDSAGSDALFLDEDHNHVKARNVARLSYEYFLNADECRVPSLCYIRKSDAEINRKDS
jgi:tRNA threonylcarbamoyladenosine biosynthesis protein TsaB